MDKTVSKKKPILSGPAYRKGGSKPKGFAANPERARQAGAKGGKASRRRKKVV